MINFASVTGIQIPEGSANALAIGSQLAWSAGDWDLSWVYHGALPPYNIWTMSGATNAQNEGAIRLNSAGSTAVLCPHSSAFQVSDRCVFEVEIKIASTGTPDDGVEIQLAGIQSANPNALMPRIWTGTGGTTLFDTPDGVIEFSLNQWYTIRLELNITGNANFVMLDDNSFELPNGLLYITENEGAFIWVKNSDCYVRALRYKAL